jgi:hypothetical protein
VTRVIPRSPVYGMVVSSTPRWRTLSVRPTDAAVARVLKTVVFFIGADVKFSRNGEACHFKDIRLGDPIRVSFVIEKGPAVHVTRLEAGSYKLSWLPSASQWTAYGICLTILLIFLLAVRGLWKSFTG